LKKLITFRFDPDLLASARMTAERENRTLTNLVETALKEAVETRTSTDDQTSSRKPGREA
jgi:hypothetical protein